MARGQQAKDLMERLIDAVRSQEFPYEPTSPQPRDWSRYDRAQVEEVANVLELIRDAVDAAWNRIPDNEKQRTGRGQPPKPADDVAKALLVQQYFNASNRQTQGLVDLFREKLGIRSRFSYKTIERGYNTPMVRRVLDEVFDSTVKAARGHESGVAVDGTGLPTNTKTNYERDKTRRTMSHWEYLVSSTGLDTQLITGFQVLPNRNDSERSVLPDVLPSPDVLPGLELGVADANFLSRANVETMHERGMRPRIFPKRGQSFKSHGTAGWAPMLRSFITDPFTWLRDYHRRSLVETTYSVWKRLFKAPLRRKLKPRRDTEAHARTCVYNLRRLVYLQHIDQWRSPYASTA